MNIEELIKTRRSIKDFKNIEIPDQLIKELLETAIYAPNHRMTQPWRFIVIKDEGKIKYAQLKRDIAMAEMSDITEDLKKVQGDKTYETISKIPAILFIVVKKNGDHTMAQEDYAACACVTQNFLLLAWDKGLGTAWKTFTDKSSIRSLLILEDDEQVVSVVYIGYPNTSPPPKPRNEIKISYMNE